MTERLISASRIVDSAQDGPGWLLVRDGVIADAGTGVPPRQPDDELAGLLPAFIDGHVHGALGADFGAPGVDPSPAIGYHASVGSTRLVASLATAELDVLIARLRELAPLVHDGALEGLHLEGPFLADARRGAHDPRLLLEPDPASVAALLAAADGALRLVTLAPELPGGIDAVRRFVDAGVTVALGHTDADEATMLRAVDAGATVITHVFNGMPPLHHRAPGPVGVALTDPRLTVEVIGDGVHLEDRVVDLVRGAAAGRMTFVSDAMAATGLSDGRYLLGAAEVDVSGGVAMLVDGSSLAGSTTSVAGAVERLLARGADLPEIVASTSTAPARALGLAEPSLAPGHRADLVELDAGRVRRVMKEGSWLPSSS